MSTLVKITVNQTTDLVSVKVFQAENGAQGDRAGLKYTFSTSTGPGAPSPGYLKFNSATLSAVTRIAIRDTDFDGADTTALLALIDDSTSTMKARVLIRSNSNSDTSNFNFLVTSVTDEGNHFHINGTYVSGSAFADDEVVTFDFYMTGDLGATGPAPSGTGFVKVVSGVLQTPSASIAQADVTNLTSDLALKAPLISPSFTTPALGVATATSINAAGINSTVNTVQLVTASARTIDIQSAGLSQILLDGKLDTTGGPGTFATVIAVNKTLTLACSGGNFSATVAKSGTVAMTADKLSAFAATTSAELAGVISDETGSGSLVFGTSPTLTTPILQHQYASLASDQVFQSDTVLRDITGLTLTLAPGTYKISGLVIATPGSSTMGTKIGFSYSGAGTFFGTNMFTNNNTLLSLTGYSQISLATGVDTRTINAGGNSQPAQSRHDLVVVVTSTTVLKYQIAQQTSIALNMTAEAGSFLIAERIV